MSTRLGMADGRCTTINISSRLFNESVIDSLGIQVFDNYNYRMKLQSSNPEDVIPAATCSLFSYKDIDRIDYQQ
mgnify:CR=1 FL=1